MKIPCIKSYIVVGIFEDLEDVGEWSAPLEIKTIPVEEQTNYNTTEDCSG